MKIGIANDHGAVALKNALKAAFPQVEWVDVGAEDPDVSVDYPDFGNALAQLIEKGVVQKGVVLCGSGVGITIAANRNRAVRAFVCNEPYTAQLARQHNDANVIGFGGRLIGPQMAIECLRVFLSTEFEGGRHTKRVEKLS